MQFFSFFFAVAFNSTDTVNSVRTIYQLWKMAGREKETKKKTNLAKKIQSDRVQDIASLDPQQWNQTHKNIATKGPRVMVDDTLVIVCANKHIFFFLLFQAEAVIDHKFVKNIIAIMMMLAARRLQQQGKFVKIVFIYVFHSSDHGPYDVKSQLNRPDLPF